MSSAKPYTMPAEEALVLIEKVKRIGTDVVAAHADSVDRIARFPSESMAALREAKMLSLLVPSELGGQACRLRDVATMCEVLAGHCASTAMAFAMHHIQVISIARHHGQSAFFRDYLTRLVEKQFVIASVTSEVGVGGEMSRSIAAVDNKGDGRIVVNKDASTLSYGEYADDLLLSARRHPDAAGNDQVLVLLTRGDFQLEKTTSWDTLGMRGTCSPGFKVTSTGKQEQVLADSFADICAHTMVPVSHIVWASVWLGIAASAIARAHAYVRQQARAKPGQIPLTGTRLAEASSKLQVMRMTVHDLVVETEELMARSDLLELSSMGFALKTNNLKISASQMVVDIVQQALLIVGITGYKNDSKFSLGRHLRDAYSAQLQLNNDRLLQTNASWLLVLKD